MKHSMALLAPVLVIVACAETGGGEATPPGAAPTWHVDTEPVVSIGVVEGPTHYQLTYPQGVRRMDDGRILVAEAGEQELRFYDAGGEFLNATGGEGEGPGEFRFLAGAWVFAGDSIIAWDPTLQRLSIFAPSGDFVRSFRLEGVSGFAPEVHDAFRDDGALIVQPLQAGDILHITAGPRRDTLPISIVSPQGVLERTVGEFAASERFGAGPVYGARAFGAEALVAAGDHHFYYSSSDSLRIERWTRDGRLEDVIAREHTPRPISEMDQQNWRDRRIESASGRGREFTIAWAREMTFPTAMPALRALHVDRDENLWARYYEPAGGPNRWVVFAPDGSDLAEAELPPGLEPHDIGTDWILGIVRDDAGVPTVRMHRLRKN